MNDGILVFGTMMAILGLLIIGLGQINPSACGSGNCIESPKFYYVFGSISIIGVLLMLISVVVDRGETKS